MFEALEVYLLFLERLVPVEAKIRRRSRALADQLSEAADSVALNMGEGRGRRGGNGRRHFDIAKGSAGEVTVALRVAVARQYITCADRDYVDEPLDRVRAMLFKMTR